MKNKNTARDFFLYLFATATLYFSAIAFITLLWQYVNHFFPEPFRYYYSQEALNGPMRFAISSLIIIFPIYVTVAWWLNRDLDKNPAKRNFAVRKWLIYITLFVTAATVVVDLVVLLNEFLSGDFSARFTLRALAVLIVAAAVFMHYIFNLRRKPGTKVKTQKIIVWITSAIVASAVIGAFFLIGTPASNRDVQYDDTRVTNLRNIQQQILSYYKTTERLPQSLSALEDDFDYFTMPTDPETGEDYEYNVLDSANLRFNLCASFNTESISIDETDTAPRKPVYYLDEINEDWTHSVGRKCFERTIDPERHPIRESREPIPLRL